MLDEVIQDNLAYVNENSQVLFFNGIWTYDVDFATRAPLPPGTLFEHRQASMIVFSSGHKRVTINDYVVLENTGLKGTVRAFIEDIGTITGDSIRIAVRFLASDLVEGLKGEDLVNKTVTFKIRADERKGYATEVRLLT